MNNENEMLVINPKRRRRSHKRRMSALQRHYFGGGGKKRRRCNPPVQLNARRARRSHGGYRVVHRVVRRNPVTGLMNTVVSVVKDGAVMTAGIAANNLVGNVLGRYVLKVQGTNRQLVKVGTAALLPIVLGMVLPAWKKEFCLGGSAALAMEATKMLQSQVYPTIGDVGKLLSTNDNDIAFIGPVTPGATGMLPGGMPYGRQLAELPGGPPYAGVSQWQADYSDTREGAY